MGANRQGSRLISTSNLQAPILECTSARGSWDLQCQPQRLRVHPKLACRAIGVGREESLVASNFMLRNASGKERKHCEWSFGEEIPPPDAYIRQLYLRTHLRWIRLENWSLQSSSRRREHVRGIGMVWLQCQTDIPMQRYIWEMNATWIRVSLAMMPFV